jgi:hypothetical protein
MDCFAEPVIGPHSRDPLARNDGESGNAYLPGLSSKPSDPAAMLTPTWPSTHKGCSAIELAEPPTRRRR